MSDWAPSQNIYVHIVRFLIQSRRQPKSDEVARGMNELIQMPDFNCYLALIFAQGTEDEDTRSLAGLMLKNNLLNNAAAYSPSVRDFVKRTCLPCIGHPTKLFRTTFGMIASSLIINQETGSWPELVASLPSFFQSSNPDELDGAIGTLLLVLEDASNSSLKERDEQMCAAIINDIDANFSGKLIEFLLNTNHSVQQRTLACLKQLVCSGGKHVLQMRDSLLTNIFQMVNSADASTLLSICQFFNEYIEKDLDAVATTPHINSIIELMLQCSVLDNKTISLEACEFWIALLADNDSRHCRMVTLHFLPRLIPVLLTRMVYSEEELKELLPTLDANDTHVPDNANEIAPHFAKAKQHHGEDRHDHGEEFAPGGEENEDEWDDDEDDDEDDELNGSEWTLRKCAAAALDILANMFPTEILEPLLPLLLTHLQSSDWKQRECGILALGAIADGCLTTMSEHLPALIPFLINSLPDTNILIKCISCWTLGRYSSWIVKYSSRDMSLFTGVLQGFLTGVHENNKRIQQAACSALASFEECSGELLIPFLPSILPALMSAFQQYQARNLHIMYDAIGTLAEAVGSALNDEALLHIILPPLYEKWMSLQDTDLGLVPLLECLAGVAFAAGLGFSQYAEPVFTRCLNLIDLSVPIVQNDYGEEFFRNLLIVSLDMISGLADGMGLDFAPVIAPHVGRLVNLVLVSTRIEDPDVRQSAFALIGDLTSIAFGHVQYASTQFVIAIESCLDPRYPSSCNNAVWALGELALRMANDIRPFVPSVLGRLVHILVNIRTPKTLPENTAICIGRLGSVCPDLVAPHLGEFAVQWCENMRAIKDNDEKDSAFRGMCSMIQLNSQPILTAFVYFCDAVASWTEETIAPDLKQHLKQILFSYKQGFGDVNWSRLMNTMPPQLAFKLQSNWEL